MSIRRDLDLGESAENRIISMFNEVGLASEKYAPNKKFSDFDLMSTYDGSQFTSEIKYDIYAVRSGNIAIEVFNPKKGSPSGLTATKADLWIHITDEIHVANVSKFKEWVENNKPFRIISAGGDDNATLYLYKKDAIFNQEVFERIDLLSGDLLKQAILGLLK